MSQKVHVPKFGTWDRENIPYTRCFENARRERGAASKIVNPNDPEENPEAFMPEYTNKHQVDNSNNYGTVNSDRVFQGYMGTLVNRFSAYQKALHLQKSGNHGDSNLDTGNVKNSYDHSVPASHRRCRSSKYSMDGGFGYSRSRARQSIPQTGNNGQREVQHRRVQSVPKFGDWDETDPANGFTFIFDKVKEEKKITAATLPVVSIETVTEITAPSFPVVPTEPVTYPDKQKIRRYTSSRAKIFRCLYPAADH